MEGPQLVEAPQLVDAQKVVEIPQLVEAPQLVETPGLNTTWPTVGGGKSIYCCFFLTSYYIRRRPGLGGKLSQLHDSFMPGKQIQSADRPF